MNVLFLDIDGVCNSKETAQRHRGFIGIDPYMAFLVGNMVDDLDLKVVLSSSWRHSKDGIDEVKSQVCDLLDITGDADYTEEKVNTQRGREIKAWLDKHPEVLRYAILDDDTDMLPEQFPNFFKTSWDTGMTPEIVEKIKKHFE